KLACRLQSPIEVNRGENRFQRIHQERGLSATAAFLFAPAQSQVVTQFELLRYLDQVPFADQMGAQLREFTFAKLWKPLEQLLAGDERQHRVAQKFHLLVVADLIFAVRSRQLLRFLFTRLRAMRDRLLHDGAPPEVVAQRRFQRRDFPFFHCGIPRDSAESSLTSVVPESGPRCPRSASSTGLFPRARHRLHSCRPWLNQPPGWHTSTLQESYPAYREQPTSGRPRWDRRSAAKHQLTS